MLVLTRRLNEGILIGDDIEIRITRIDGETVKLGIEAPRHVAIYRDEVFRQMQDANRVAARKPGESVPRLRISGPANVVPCAPNTINHDH
jgi:carbon storage regulator